MSKGKGQSRNTGSVKKDDGIDVSCLSSDLGSMRL